ncbi:hypothetical protein JQ615_26505 [Bradyrhizobium jicamae]|uniref:Uncharacterized protein n=1 Tax=Bradyrhizobium jicamae TaxID=280332 RepID=A0ABS5FQ58_9BRAD|nr:hypothetical protein [Bradyrhizobium jicamae]MBR0798945.1 hypothetical protein [Bradyrhizobium jicamae]
MITKNKKTFEQVNANTAPAFLQQDHDEERRRDIGSEPRSLDHDEIVEFYMNHVNWAWALHEAARGDPAWLFAKMLKGSDAPPEARSVIDEWRRATTFRTNRKKLNLGMFTRAQYALGVAADEYHHLKFWKTDDEAISGALDAAIPFGGVTLATLKLFLNGRYRGFTLKDWKTRQRRIRKPKRSISKRKKKI